MKKYIYSFLLFLAVAGTGCENLLDRPTLTMAIDDNFWRDETDLRLFANGFYELYFVGYNRGYSTDFAPVRSTTFSDDLVWEGVQSNFENSVPTSRSSSSESRSCMTQYYGPTWGFARVRKANIFLDRIENVARPHISEEAFLHWTAVAKFFKGYEYADLVNVFGDVPWFETTVMDNDPETMYKDRDDRGMVMDKVYELFEYALDHLREDDGAQNLNRYIAAGFVSRFMLNEGTWQKYHGLDASRAEKYLKLAVRAGDMVLEKDKWSCDKDFKSLFVSADLSGHPEVLLHRHYDSALGVMHHIASYTGGKESQTGVNLALVKAFTCNDGMPYQLSSVPGADDFSLANLAVTRDPRFDASFVAQPHNRATSLIYCYKFASREALEHYLTTGDELYDWSSERNINDAPVMRLGEIVLNWIEAKAELALTYGGTAVTQEDLDKSVNALRNRPLDEASVRKGLKKTSPLLLNAIPDDPARDADVTPLLWEIRRERRMELLHEGNRIKDLRRWKKLDYMDCDKNTDHYLGPWVNFPEEYPVFMEDMVNVLRVKKEDGSVVLYDGTNPQEMVGFYMVRNAVNRDPFTDRSYLAPIGQQQIDDYAQRGYKLTQTKLW
ncbi:MAG: RagB/SusD family nutrient uptake outer membrane protein [Bacteroides sp.]|nr:RagB/SusD family nutrient uptake outer membrane protein [Bacteroides sp.]